MIYSLPPMQFLRDAQEWKWVEMGAGTGLWLRIFKEAGIDAIGYDINPQGPDVIEGDHTNFAKHPDRIALIVWPPDRTHIETWLEHYTGKHVCVVGNFRRLLCPDYPVVDQWEIHGGFKGTSQIKLMEIER